MFQSIICLFVALVVVASANNSVIQVTLNSGKIIQGINATGVIVKKIKNGQELTWTENQDNLKVTFMKIFENTGMIKNYDLDNVCDNQKKGSIKDAVKGFVLQVLGKTNECPIKKDTKIKLSYPINFSFQTTEDEKCGPIVVTINIVKNNSQKDSKLLISSLFRGTVTSC